MESKLKEIKAWARAYKEKLGKYGIRLRIEIDRDYEWPDERYQILVNDELFSNDLTKADCENDIVALSETFEIFKALPAYCYANILVDRETKRIQDALITYDGKDYQFFIPEFHEEVDEPDVCPLIKTIVDEIHITDSKFHEFYVHGVSMDDNGNVKLTGRIADPDYGFTEELYTYLGSVLEFDLSEIQIPKFGEE